jgi:predicted phage terminase large subunit-like protein
LRELAVLEELAKARGIKLPPPAMPTIHSAGPAPLLPWLQSATPNYTWTWKYLLYIQEYLNKVTTGEIKRLILSMPPRHGKSSLTTIRYPVYRIEQDPTFRVIIGAYNKEFSTKFGRDTLRIARGRVPLSRERKASSEWETTEGGGVYAAGVGSPPTGRGANLLIIDDPVKSRKEANSRAYQEQVWDWYTNDMYSRLEPGAAIIVIMTRWHMADLVGKLLDSDAEEWVSVVLPAEAEENDPLGRAVGEALCPERYNKMALAKARKVLQRDYFALYQQRPQPREGELFQRAWLPIVPVAPAKCRLVRYWDKASALSGDYTAGVLMGELDGQYYVIDVVHGRWSTAQRERIMRQTAELDAERFGDRVSIWIEQEGGSGGLDSARASVSNLAGFKVRTEHPTGDKATRAEPFANQAEGGNVALVRGKWNDGYLDELTSFPSGAHDDQVDASGGAFNKLARPGVIRLHSATA